MNDPKEPPPMVYGELSQPPRPRRLAEAVYQSGSTGPTGPLTLRSPDLNGPPGPINVNVFPQGAVAVGHAAGEGRASGAGAAVAEAVGSTVVGTNNGTYSISGGNAGGVVTTTVRIGRVAIANRDAILVQAVSIELLLSDTIERARVARSNSQGLPELEAILEAVVDLRTMLLATARAPAEASVGQKALSIKEALINWWDKDHLSILDRSFNMGLFAGGLVLCASFGLIPAVTVATLIRGKEIGEAIKAAAEVLKNLRSGD